MVRVAPVRLLYNPRTLWFDPCGLELKQDEQVVVETARGTEFGTMAGDIIEVTEESIAALPVELKPVLRLATDADCQMVEDNQRKNIETLPIFKELAAESGLDMRPISVEYLLDGDKAVFHFEAEERVDFRELVRKLASRLHIRVDMHQMGARDEARLIGGIGHCGQELCCKRFAGDFQPVAMRMAKEQDLSVNPQKNSGLCGRLMCCLRYEYDVYKDFHDKAPREGATIKTPDGDAKVVGINVPQELISLKLEGVEKPKKVPFSYFKKPAEGERPSVIEKASWEKVLEQEEASIQMARIYLTTQFTAHDAVATAGSINRIASASGATSPVSSSSLAGKSTTSVKNAQGSESSVSGRRRRDRGSRKAATNMAANTSANVSTNVSAGTSASLSSGGSAYEKEATFSRTVRRRGQVVINAGMGNTAQQTPASASGASSSAMTGSVAASASAGFAAASSASSASGAQKSQARFAHKGQGATKGASQASSSQTSNQTRGQAQANRGQAQTSRAPQHSQPSQHAQTPRMRQAGNAQGLQTLQTSQGSQYSQSSANVAPTQRVVRPGYKSSSLQASYAGTADAQKGVASVSPVKGNASFASAVEQSSEIKRQPQSHRKPHKRHAGNAQGSSNNSNNGQGSQKGQGQK